MGQRGPPHYIHHTAEAHSVTLTRAALNTNKRQTQAWIWVSTQDVHDISHGCLRPNHACASSPSSTCVAEHGEPLVSPAATRAPRQSLSLLFHHGASRPSKRLPTRVTVAALLARSHQRPSGIVGALFPLAPADRPVATTVCCVRQLAVRAQPGRSHRTRSGRDRERAAQLMGGRSQQLGHPKR